MNSYKKLLICFLFYPVLLFLAIPVIAQPSQGASLDENNKALRILVIGNSFSENATSYLPQLAEEGGHQISIQKAQIGGGSLKMHWDALSIAESNPDNPKGKPYRGKSLKMLLMMGEYDFISLQQVSTQSAYPESYYPYVEDLYNYVIKYQPKAKILIHQIWPYRTDSKNFSKTAANAYAKSSKEMWEKSRAAYHQVAGRFNARIIPSGDAFHVINSSKRWAFVPDANFNFKNPEYPKLPNQDHSLNIGYYWDKDKNLKFDSNHANLAGCYLGALVWYSTLFNESPRKLKFSPTEISGEFARQLRKVAWKVAK